MINCEQLQKKYGKKEVFHNISLQIDEPKIIALIGRNGAGKSTLLRTIAGYTKATTGSIQVLNGNPFNSLKVANNLILVDEKMAFPAMLNVGQLIEYAAKFNSNFQKQLAFDLLSFANIPATAYHHVLSRGQKGIFNLIYALASRMQITLLDEPMNGLDEVARDDFYRAILKEYIAYPRLMIISSHHLNELENLIEEIVLIDSGEVKIHASVDMLQNAAIVVKGTREVVEQLTKDEKILGTRENNGYYEAVIEMPVSEALINNPTVLTQSLSANEYCKVIVQNGRGVIDDVFK